MTGSPVLRPKAKVTKMTRLPLLTLMLEPSVVVSPLALHQFITMQEVVSLNLGARILCFFIALILIKKWCISTTAPPDLRMTTMVVKMVLMKRLLTNSDVSFAPPWLVLSSNLILLLWSPSLLTEIEIEFFSDVSPDLRVNGVSRTRKSLVKGERFIRKWTKDLSWWPKVRTIFVPMQTACNSHWIET